MAEQRDFWSKLEIASSIIGGVFLPLMVWYVGGELEAQQDEAAEEQLRADRAISLLGYMGSENPRQRLLAAKTAEYLLDQNQLPEELWLAFLEIAATDTNPQVVEAYTGLVSERSASDPEFAERAEATYKDIEPRVSIHYSTPRQEALARKLVREFKGLDFVVPPIDLEPLASSQFELRCFRDSEFELAKQTAERLRNAGYDIKARQVNVANLNRVPRWHYEVWIGENAQAEMPAASPPQ